MSNCPRCGAPLPANSPERLCPRCLLAAGLADPSQASTGATPGPSPATAAYGAGFQAPALDELQKLFPNLEILEFLGKGGMGAVYKARQINLDRMVALKILPPQVGRDPTFAERFTREAKALAQLSHPHIVGVHDSGKIGDQFYFIMEYVDGVNLRQAMRAGELLPAQALAIVPQICDALQYAHDVGVVHRDIKPENLLLDRRGRVKIADFGLAKLLTRDPADAVLTGTQQAMGTVHYMAPEQIEGARNVDHRADIYSLGVTFYEMLTGELPLGRFAPPSQKVQIDVRLDEVVLRTLEKEPEKRYQQVSQVKTEVESIGGIGPVSAVALRRVLGGEYRSRAEIFGIPLLHVAFGIDPRTGRRRIAKGIVAIGDAAIGGIAFGGMAAGGIAFGGLAFGLVSLGGMSVALLAALGGVAVGGFAFGGCACGGIALGGYSVGYYAFGGSGLGVHAYFHERRDPEAVLLAQWFQDWHRWLTWLSILTPVSGVAIFLFVWLVFWLSSQPRRTNEVAEEARRHGWSLLITGIIYWVFAALLGLLVFALESRMRTAQGARAESPTQWYGLVSGLFGSSLFAAVFAGTLMIVGGVRLMRLEKSIVTRLGAMLALIPMTIAWLQGLPVGLKVLLFLGRSDVEAELERRERARRARDDRARQPDGESPWYALGWLVGTVFRARGMRVVMWTLVCVVLFVLLGVPSFGDAHTVGGDAYGYVDRSAWPYAGNADVGLNLTPRGINLQRIVLQEHREVRRLGWGRGYSPWRPDGPTGELNVNTFTVKATLPDGTPGPELSIDARAGLKWRYTTAAGLARNGDFPIDHAVALQWMRDSGVADIDAKILAEQTDVWLEVIHEAVATDQAPNVAGIRPPPGIRPPVGRLERIFLAQDRKRGGRDFGVVGYQNPYKDCIGTEHVEFGPVFNILWVSLPVFLVVWLGGLYYMLRRG